MPGFQEARRRVGSTPKTSAASVDLANLYGTPATDRRVTAHIDSFPSAFSFPSFPGYLFTIRCVDEKKEHQEQTVDLGEQENRRQRRDAIRSPAGALRRRDLFDALRLRKVLKPKAAGALRPTRARLSRRCLMCRLQSRCATCVTSRRTAARARSVALDPQLNRIADRKRHASTSSRRNTSPF